MVFPKADRRVRGMFSSPRLVYLNRWKLLLAKIANAAVEGAAVVVDVSWEGMSGVDDAVGDRYVGVVSDVVEAAAQGPIASEEMKALFELEIDRVISGKTERFGICSRDFSLVGSSEKGLTGARFVRVHHIELVDDGQTVERQDSVPEEAVGSVPRVGAGALRRQ